MEIKCEKDKVFLDYSIVKTEFSIQDEGNVENIKQEPPEEESSEFAETKDEKCDSLFIPSVKYEVQNENLPCCICGETFKNDRLIRQHIRTHFKSWGSLKCRKCGKVFKTQYNLTYHNLVIHSRMKETEAMSKKYSCKDCGKGFYSKDRYQRHLTVHSNVRKFQCSLCEKNFKLGYSLDQHLKFAHSSERPFSCTVCTWTFKYKQGLTQHMKTHERKLPLSPRAIKDEENDCQISVKSEN